MLTLVKLRQPKNELSSIVVTDEGMLTLVKILHPANAPPSIDLTEDGITYVSVCFPAGYAIMVRMVLSNTTPSTLM
jgi:hypothetical protein